MAKATFKDSLAEYSRLRDDISKRKLAKMYLLMGEQSFFIDQLSDLLEDNVLNESEKAFCLTQIYGKDATGGAVVNMCRQMPMIGSTQLVIIKEAQSLKDIDQLVHYAKSPQQSTILVICYKQGVMDRRSVLYKNIADKGVVFESVTPRDYEIGTWLNTYISGRGLKIDATTLQLLAEHLGTDLSKIAGEIDKLITAIPVGETVIRAEAVEQNIGISRQFNNFELTKALSERNLKKALNIADYFAQNPKNNPFVVTISMLFSHFQRMFMMNYKVWECQTKRIAMPNDFEMTKLLKLSMPFFLKEYQAAARNYPLPKLFVILGLIREYDMKSKGINGGPADNGQLLQELILKIMMS